MRIKKIITENFKGIQSLTIEANGRNVTIWGDNGTGKTTLADSFRWLLFGRDSHETTKFDVLPIPPEGAEREHDLTASVEYVLDVDGTELSLKKTMMENWVRRRGASVDVKDGNTFEYFIDGVSKGETAFKVKVASIADEKLFKVLTNPLYFSEVMDWKDRRKMLLEVCGDITDEDIIELFSKLKDVPAILAGASSDERRKVIQAAQTKINKRLQEIPVAVKEVKLGMPALTANMVEIRAQIAKLQKEQDGCRQEIASIQNGSEISAKKRRLNEIDSDLLQLKNGQENKKIEALKELRKQEGEVISSGRGFQTSADAKSDAIDACNRKISALEQEINDLYDQWDKADAETFVYLEFALTQETICTYCGSEVPLEKLNDVRETAEKVYNEARSQAEAAFNLNKSNRLERITERGKTAKKEMTDKKAELDTLTKEHAELVKKVGESKTKLVLIQQQIVKAQNGVQDVTELPEYKSLVSSKDVINAEITALQNGNIGKISTLQNSISELAGKISELQKEVAKEEQITKDTNRIEELKTEEKKNSKEFEQYSYQLNQLDEFTKAKVSMLDEKINSKFQCARFKLFEKNETNEGIKECCDTLINTNGVWVPFASNGNSGGKLNSGIDIANTLSQYYGIEIPIFVDNAESVTKLLDSNAQMFKLVVSEPDKVLRVEVEA